MFKWSHLLTNSEVQKYYQNEPNFNSVYSRDTFPKIKHGTCLIDLDKYESAGSHWTALHVICDNVTYFDSSRVEHIPKEIKKTN